MDERFEVGLALARKAGLFLLENNDKIEISQLSSYDVKLKQDIESEKIIIGGIEKSFPEDGYLSEEKGEKNSHSGYLWTIDPLDGTVNYSRGIPQCCISIACKSDNSAFGIVYDFFRDEMFTGIKDKGAFLNGRQITVSATSELKDAIISFGLMKEYEEIKIGLALFESLSTKVKKIRMMGAAALDLCYVAAGRVDGLVEAGLYPWDVAAGKTILEEAGGRYKEFVGKKKIIQSYADNRRLNVEAICKNP